MIRTRTDGRTDGRKEVELHANWGVLNFPSQHNYIFQNIIKSCANQVHGKRGQRDLLVCGQRHHLRPPPGRRLDYSKVCNHGLHGLQSRCAWAVLEWGYFIERQPTTPQPLQSYLSVCPIRQLSDTSFLGARFLFFAEFFLCRLSLSLSLAILIVLQKKRILKI